MTATFVYSGSYLRKLLVTTIILSVLLGSAAPVGVIAAGETTKTESSVETPPFSDTNPQAEITNTTRTLNQSAVEPGGAVRVTVTTGLNSTGDPALYEQIDPAPSNVSITATDPTAVVDAVANNSDEVVVIWEATNSSVAEYVINIPENASTEAQINISGVVETQNETIPIENNTVTITSASDGTDGGDGSNDGSDGGGSGGSSGGGATPVDPTVQLDITDRPGGGATVAVEAIPTGTDINATLAEVVTGEGSALQSLTVAHRITPDNYRIEVTDIRETPTSGSPRIDSSSIIGYLDVEFIGTDNIESATLRFRVSDETLPDAATVADVSVYRYNNEWETIETRHVRSDGGTHYIEATADGFSPFAIGVPRGDITIQDTAIDANTTQLNESINVQASLTNEGAIADEINLTLSDDGGARAEQQVTVPAGETVTVSLETSFDEAGTYELSVNGVSAGEVSVAEPSTDTDTQPENENTADESPGFGVLLTLIAIMIMTVHARRIAK